MSEDEGQSGSEDEGSDTGRSFAARQRPPRAVAAAAAAAAPTAAASSSTAAGRALRRKIAIEYISDRNRRHITFSKRKVCGGFFLAFFSNLNFFKKNDGNCDRRG